MQVIQTSAAGHTPRAEDDDPNAPWLPKIPGPRKPSATPEQATANCLAVTA